MNANRPSASAGQDLRAPQEVIQAGEKYIDLLYCLSSTNYN